MNITDKPLLFYKKPLLEVQDIYTQRRFSDVLKAGSCISVSDKVQRIFFEHGFQGAQFIPLLVNNNGTHDGYAFMHKIATYDLLDPITSEADGFCVDENIYTHIITLYLDKARFKTTNIEHDIFMCSTYCSEFICNERVKKALEDANVTGIEFEPVEFSS
ncbi:imm11 family protein [Shewanella pealeana]